MSGRSSSNLAFYCETCNTIFSKNWIEHEGHAVRAEQQSGTDNAKSTATAAAATVATETTTTTGAATATSTPKKKRKYRIDYDHLTKAPGKCLKCGNMGQMFIRVIGDHKQAIIEHPEHHTQHGQGRFLEEQGYTVEDFEKELNRRIERIRRAHGSAISVVDDDDDGNGEDKGEEQMTPTVAGLSELMAGGIERSP